MLRMVFTVFSSEFVNITPTREIFLLLGAFGVIIASVAAIYQDDIKRLLAYSSIAQVSYMVLGIGLASTLGITAALVHVFNHALMKGALFMACGALVYRVGSSRFEDLKGLGRRMPWTFAAIFVAGLSLIGIPGTAGFISKWYFILAALENQSWPIIIIAVLGSLLALVYVWRIVELMFLQPLPDSGRAVDEAPASLLIPMWFLVIANIYFGFNTELTVDVAGTAARLLGVGAYNE
jgi:multicomponent Na+:H+ antiporter subunit D